MEEKKQETTEVASVSPQNFKKKLLLILGIALGALILLLTAVALITGLGKKDNPGFEYGEEHFYPTYEGDIMQNKAYLDLDRSISYCADPAGYGETSSITDENRKDYSAEVLFLYDYLQTVIAGDANAYNKLFNEAYYKNKENKPLESFSPQMIYQAKITYQTEAKEGTDRLVVYRLEYMIYRNDGTFRRDIASDSSRPQNIRLRVSADGSIAIENISTLYIQ